jgi:hypothetical protein
MINQPKRSQNRLVFICLTIIVAFFSNCSVTNSIESIKCVQHKYGNDHSSKSFQLEIIAEDDNFDERTTSDPVVFSQTRYAIKHYNIKVRGARRIKKTNVFVIEHATPPRAFHQVEVIAELKKRPFILDSMTFVIDYKGTIRRDFTQGISGAKGPDVNVYVALVSNSQYFEHYGCHLYQVSIETGNSRELLYMSEADSRLEIISRGATGFNGENGANGVEGAMVKKKREGQPGHGGGWGGTGGSVTLYRDSSALGFQKILAVDTRGGNGGQGGLGGKGGEGGDRLLIDGKKSNGSDRVLIDGKRDNGSDGANGPNGGQGANGPELKVIEKEVFPFD